jgi:hypothetical protein
VPEPPYPQFVQSKKPPRSFFAQRAVIPITTLFCPQNQLNSSGSEFFHRLPSIFPPLSQLHLCIL